jgi:hypothetical protein
MMSTYTDREYAAAKRELLRGCPGRERACRARWMDALRLAGIDITRGPRGIGPNEMRLAETIRETHPAAYEMFAEAHRIGTADFLRRLPPARASAYLHELAEQDPELYGPLVAV